jgi:hypothetical protein
MMVYLGDADGMVLVRCSRGIYWTSALLAGWVWACDAVTGRIQYAFFLLNGQVWDLNQCCTLTGTGSRAEIARSLV